MRSYRERIHNPENIRLKRQVLNRGKAVAASDADNQQRLANKLGRKWRIRKAEYRWRAGSHNHFGYYG